MGDRMDYEGTNIFINEQNSATARSINYVPESMSHPAKFPPDLIRRLIKTYSKEGETILDPMCGIGTLLVEGMQLGRNVIGVEYEPRFKEIVDKNVELVRKNNESSPWPRKLGKAIVIRGDSRELSNLVRNTDVVISSPPYANRIDNSHGESGERISEEKSLPTSYSKDESNIGNLKYDDGIVVDAIVSFPPFEDQIAGSKETDKFGKFNNESYSTNKEDENQLGNLTGETYISEMLKIYSECFKVLKSGGFMVLIVKNPRKDGKELDLEADTVKLCKAAGFDLYQKCVHVLNQASFWQQNAKIKALEKGEPYLLPMLEFILVFKKPKVI